MKNPAFYVLALALVAFVVFTLFHFSGGF